MLDVAAGLAWQGDRRIELRPQAFAVLEQLVRHGGELVTKDQLLDAVWGDRVVTEDSITQCISEIRAALGEPGQTMLHTVPRRGYRLEAEVIAGRPAQAPDQPSSGFGRLSMVVAGLIFVVLLAIFVGTTLRNDPGEPTAPSAETSGEQAVTDRPADAPEQATAQKDEPPSLAVLPFVFRGADDAQRYLADGLHDDLLTTLSRSTDLRVISRTSVMTYGDSEQSLREIGRELGVNHVLEGSVEIQGSEIRVVVQLIESESDTHLWADSYDRTLAPETLFQLRDELSQAIALALEAQLGATPRLTDSLPAFEAYQRGLQLLYRGGTANLEASAEHFQRAIEADPRFADAWVGYANSQLVLAENGAVEREMSWTRREEALERALEIDPAHSGAHTALAWLHYDRVRAFPEQAPIAEAAFRKAIALNPNDSRAHMGYALLLNLAFPERIAESIELLEEARRLDPRSRTVLINLAATYRFMGLLDPAERALLDILEWDTANNGARRVLGRLYADWGRLAQAYELMEEAVEIDPRNVIVWSALGEYALELRHAERAREVLEQMRVLAPDHPATAVHELLVLDRAGERDAVMAGLERVLDQFGTTPEIIRFGVFRYLIARDESAARRWFDLLTLFDDESAWPGIIRIEADRACVLGWFAQQAGRADEGARLVTASRRYLMETLPASRDHVDRYKPDLCHLAAGETALALDSIEQQLAHRHVYLWDDWHRLPLYDTIRNDPRYEAAWVQYERILAEERQKAGLERAEQSLAANQGFP